MLTELGKYLRKLRIDRGELLKDMAEQVGMTSAYLSSIENGKRNPPDGLIEKISEKYDLSKCEQDDLEDVLAMTRNEFGVSILNADTSRREMGLTFARRFDDLSDFQITEIINILNRSGKE